MESLAKVLTEHPFLKDLDQRHIDFITGCGKNVVFKKDEFLFREGDDANEFFFIRHGRVLIETYIPEKGPVAIQTRQSGDVTGWSWMIPPYHWHFDARAIELTRAIALDGKCLRDKMDEDHELGYLLMKRFATLMAERLEATRIQLFDMYGGTTKT